MLLEFNVENYLSFKNRVVFSMIASSINEHEESNVFAYRSKERFLKSAAIYGANGSGKSNLLKAMRFMKSFVLDSSRESQVDEKIAVDSFRLSTETADAPSQFEILFIHNNIRYRYGFQVDRQEVVAEWLFYTPEVKERKLFTREKRSFSLGTDFKEGKELKEFTRDNALYISVVAQFNGKISKQILEWFRNLTIVSGLSDSHLDSTTLRLDTPLSKPALINFIKTFGLGFDDISVQTISKSVDNDFAWNLAHTIISAFKGKELYTIHKKYNGNLEPIDTEEFSLTENESDGTQKIVALSSTILDTLLSGHTLVIDELDARLHPILTQRIIKLFNSPQFNDPLAQIIFATHDTNLLSNKMFRRDQIWFTEKDQYGASTLYSLVEYKGVRNDASYGKDYILGKYGAIPFVGDFEQLIGLGDEK
jgi:AAA15 family ATPase/GTPase